MNKALKNYVKEHWENETFGPRQGEEFTAKHKSATEAHSKTVLIYGPPSGISSAVGGGVGGYVRNMEVYLSTLHVGSFRFKPLHHTVRGQFSGIKGTLAMRLAADCWNALKAIVKQHPVAVYMLAGNPGARPRELLVTKICQMMGVKVIYDIKGGIFKSTYEGSGHICRYITFYIVRAASLVLVEGKSDARFIDGCFNVEAQYFPNFVPSDEVPQEVPLRLCGDAARVLFVGYCYEPKGVKVLLEGCALAAAQGVRVALKLVGEQEANFRAFADQFELPEGMTLERTGKRSHADVLSALRESDVFCFPTRHRGEGHSNAINEAMMHGLVVITTRHGFLPDVLGEDGAFFLEEVSAAEVARVLIAINNDRETALQKAASARKRFLSEYTSDTANKRLNAYFTKLRS